MEALWEERLKSLTARIKKFGKHTFGSDHDLSPEGSGTASPPQSKAYSSLLDRIFHHHHHSDLSDTGETMPHHSLTSLVEETENMNNSLNKSHKSLEHLDQKPTLGSLPVRLKTVGHSAHRRNKHSRENLFKKHDTDDSEDEAMSSSHSRTSSSASVLHSNVFHSRSLSSLFHRKDELLGKGTHATVRLLHTDDHKLYAVKRFSKRQKSESEKDYVKKVISEFCISSSLQHPNVLETIDLLHEDGRWAEVMEFMPGGDLFQTICRQTNDNAEEMHCYFQQLLQGIHYLHCMGVAHRDLKPENLLLNENHRILKIADFGTATVFKTAWETSARKTRGIHGSDPYIAPEEWRNQEEYDPSKVDIWACGIVYFAMLYRTVPWKIAKESDPTYSVYVSKRHPEGYGYLGFDKIPEGPRALLYKILDPEPSNRPCALDLLNDPWLKSKECCIHCKESSPGVFDGELQTVTHVHVIDAHNLQQQAHWNHDSISNSHSFDTHAFRS